MSMKDELQKVVNRTVKSFTVSHSYDGLESSFTLTFTDGTELDVSSQGFSDGSSVATVDVPL